MSQAMLLSCKTWQVVLGDLWAEQPRRRQDPVDGVWAAEADDVVEHHRCAKVSSVDACRWAKRRGMLAGLINTQLAPLVWALVLVLLAIFVRQVRLCRSHYSTTAGPLQL